MRFHNQTVVSSFLEESVKELFITQRGLTISIDVDNGYRLRH